MSQTKPYFNMFKGGTLKIVGHSHTDSVLVVQVV